MRAGAGVCARVCATGTRLRPARSLLCPAAQGAPCASMLFLPLEGRRTMMTAGAAPAAPGGVRRRDLYGVYGGLCARRQCVRPGRQHGCGRRACLVVLARAAGAHAACPRHSFGDIISQVCLHGAGHTACSWALCAKILKVGRIDVSVHLCICLRMAGRKRGVSFSVHADALPGCRDGPAGARLLEVQRRV